MPSDRMSSSIFQVELHRALGREIIFGKLDLAVEDGDRVCVLQLRVGGTRAMTFRTHAVALCPQEFWMFAAVRIVASRAALLKSGLMENFLVSLFRLIDVTIQADVHRVGLGKCARLSGMRIVAVGAIALSTGMLELRLLNLFGLLGMTSDTDVFDLRLGENHFPILRRLVTDFTQLLAEGRVHESLHELRLEGLVGIVTGHAIGFAEGLPVVRLDQASVAGVVTLKAEPG
jgi:hypothetical protein